MKKLKNPPPRRVRLTKNLGNETRKFLNYLDLSLMHEAPERLRDALINNGLQRPDHASGQLEHLVGPGEKERTW